MAKVRVSPSLATHPWQLAGPPLCPASAEPTHLRPCLHRHAHPPTLADGLAYSALLKNELLGAGIEKVQDPQTEDRRLQPSTPEHKGLFTVSQGAARLGRCGTCSAPSAASTGSVSTLGCSWLPKS
jgi:hypothetical protein